MVFVPPAASGPPPSPLPTETSDLDHGSCRNERTNQEVTQCLQGSCRMKLKNSAEARSVVSKELVREMKVPKNPQRPVERHWSPPCLGWEFMSNSIRSSKDKITLDNAWVRLAMACPIHPPAYYQSKWSKMQTKVCYFSSWSLSMAPQSIQNQGSTSQLYLAKGPFPTWSQLLPTTNLASHSSQTKLLVIFKLLFL